MWKSLSRFYPLRNRWIAVCAESLETEAGLRIEPYYTLEYPDFVHVLAITAKGRILITRQYRHGFGRDMLELPGGMQDSHEADPVVTARRELEEETGHTAASYRLLGSYSVDPAKMKNRLHFVLAENAEPNGVLALDEHEHIELLSFTPEELLTAINQGQFANAAHMGLLLAWLLQRKSGQEAFCASFRPDMRSAG